MVARIGDGFIEDFPQTGNVWNFPENHSVPLFRRRRRKALA
jgi:hypothetical protein